MTAETKAPLDPDMPAEKLRLHMGELTTDELLVARAAIRWANSHRADTKPPLPETAARCGESQPGRMRQNYKCALRFTGKEVHMTTTPEPAELKPCLSQETLALLKEHARTLWVCGQGDDAAAETDRRVATGIELLLKWHSTRTPPAAPVAEDAVEALASALRAVCGHRRPDDKRDAAFIIDALQGQQGLTLRRETMTEAELEEAVLTALNYASHGARVSACVQVAKKFRG